MTSRAVKRSDLARLERMIDREVKVRFLGGAVSRVVLLPKSDDATAESAEFVVRVLVNVPGDSGPGTGSGSDEEALAAWELAHRDGMRRLRRELSLRLPEPALLEFAIEGDESEGGARIVLPHDPALAAEPVSVSEVVRNVAGVLRARYVFPDRAEQAATAIQARLEAGEYDGLTEDDVATRLTEHLFAVCADKHLRLRVEPSGPLRSAGSAGPVRLPAGPVRPDDHDAERDRHPWRKPGRLDNYGIHRVERLDGNIGFLELRRIPNPANSGQAIAAAMELVSGTEALIIDLRRNGGGSPDGVIFWCSYLFEGPEVHLNDVIVAETAETRQFWSLAYVPGERYTDRPVYVLSSGKTFSGGEDLCYTLQAQGRAKVIGETTGGGAHPTTVVPITPSLLLAVPFARSVNPVTGTNWEGTGVVPDIAVPADQAYDVAYSMALQHVLSVTAPDALKKEAQAALAVLPLSTRPEP